MKKTLLWGLSLLLSSMTLAAQTRYALVIDALDSHAIHKREAGRAHLDGFISYLSAVYTVPYGVMTPH